jgi:hypothetical protein
MATFSKFDYLKIAGEAECDPRRVKAYIEGTSNTRPALKRAIDNAIAKLGLAVRRAPEVRP